MKNKLNKKAPLQIQQLERRELLSAEPFFGSPFLGAPAIWRNVAAEHLDSEVLQAVIQARQSRAEAFGAAVNTDTLPNAAAVAETLRPELAVRLTVIQNLPDLSSRRDFAAMRVRDGSFAMLVQPSATESNSSVIRLLQIIDTQAVLASLVSPPSSVTHLVPNLTTQVPMRYKTSTLISETPIDAAIARHTSDLRMHSISPSIQSLGQDAGLPFEAKAPGIQFDDAAFPLHSNRPIEMRAIEPSNHAVRQGAVRSSDVSILVEMIALAPCGPAPSKNDSFSTTTSPISKVPILIEAIAGWSRAESVVALAYLSRSEQAYARDDNEDETHDDARAMLLSSYVVGSVIVVSCGVVVQLKTQKTSKDENQYPRLLLEGIVTNQDRFHPQ